MKWDLVRIGFVRKAHRFEGAVRVEISDDVDAKVLTHTPFLFVEITGFQVPFAIKRIEEKQYLIIHFEDVHHPEDTADLIGGSIFIERKYLAKIGHVASDGPRGHRDDLLHDFDVYDSTVGHIGKVLGIEQYPGQKMLIIRDLQGKKKLIPWVGGLLVEVDHDGQTILMQLPEGLIDLN